MYKYSNLIFCLFVFISCGSPYKVIDLTGPPIISVNHSTLKYDGLYAIFDTSTLSCGEKVSERYTIFSPLVIINSKKANWEYGGSSFNYDELTLKYYQKHPYLCESTGTYTINNDTLFAKLPIFLYRRGAIRNLFNAYFQGIIKNKDTIIDWHMVQPYPKADPKFNDSFKFLKTPHLLYFIEGKELLGLDSLYKQRLKQLQK